MRSTALDMGQFDATLYGINGMEQMSWVLHLSLAASGVHLRSGVRGAEERQYVGSHLLQ